MSKTALTELQDCSSAARQRARRSFDSFPVFFLYSAKAASTTDLKFEDRVAVWESEDTALEDQTCNNLCAWSR